MTPIPPSGTPGGTGLPKSDGTGKIQPKPATPRTTVPPTQPSTTGAPAPAPSSFGSAATPAGPNLVGAASAVAPAPSVTLQLGHFRLANQLALGAMSNATLVSAPTATTAVRERLIDPANPQTMSQVTNRIATHLAHGGTIEVTLEYPSAITLPGSERSTPATIGADSLDAVLNEHAANLQGRVRTWRQDVLNPNSNVGAIQAALKLAVGAGAIRGVHYNSTSIFAHIPQSRFVPSNEDQCSALLATIASRPTNNNLTVHFLPPPGVTVSDGTQTTVSVGVHGVDELVAAALQLASKSAGQIA